MAAGGVYGSYADIDGLFWEQVIEVDRKKRVALLHRYKTKQSSPGFRKSLP